MEIRQFRKILRVKMVPQMTGSNEYNVWSVQINIYQTRDLTVYIKVKIQ